MADTNTSIYVKYVFDSGQSVITSLPLKMNLTKNFQVWEVANTKAKEQIKLVLNFESMRFLRRAQMFRDRMGKAINATSGYRTESFNASKACGGSKNSLHLILRAIDANKIPYDEQPPYIDAWYSIAKEDGFIGGFNRYKDRIHFDDAEDKFGYKKFVIRDYTKLDKKGNPTISYRPL